jgi:type IV secretory pathway VirB6-like protein
LLRTVKKYASLRFAAMMLAGSMPAQQTNSNDQKKSDAAKKSLNAQKKQSTNPKPSA